MTKIELIEKLKQEYPVVNKHINGQDIELTAEEYEATIELWADNVLAAEAQEKADKETEALKVAQKAELLAKLGITEEEAKILLS